LKKNNSRVSIGKVFGALMAFILIASFPSCKKLNDPVPKPAILTLQEKLVVTDIGSAKFAPWALKQNRDTVLLVDSLGHITVRTDDIAWRKFDVVAMYLYQNGSIHMMTGPGPGYVGWYELHDAKTDHPSITFGSAGVVMTYTNYHILDVSAHRLVLEMDELGPNTPITVPVAEFHGQGKPAYNYIAVLLLMSR
jgi:hypothetical protein